MLYYTAESMLKPQDGSQNVEKYVNILLNPPWVSVNSTYDFEKYILNSNLNISYLRHWREAVYLHLISSWKIGLKLLGSKLLLPSLTLPLITVLTTQRDRVEEEVGGEIGMGNTCKSMADSFQCMTKPTTVL